jgi:hypothetical protein
MVVVHRVLGFLGWPPELGALFRPKKGSSGREVEVFRPL